MSKIRVAVDLPEWAEPLDRRGEVFATEEDRMRLAIELSRQNVERRSGGPFGAAIFESGSGRLVAIGVNSVVRLNNAVLHAEVMAFMRSQSLLRSFTLGGPGMPEHELVTSCEPCAMCLGAVLWSGVRRVVYAARRDDAERASFDEGPVFPESFAYLRRRGIRVESGPLRDEARVVLERYRELGGEVYNG